MSNRLLYLAGLSSVAYRSFKHMREDSTATRDRARSARLLEQWTVLALLHSYQSFAEGLVAWLPMYGLVKFVLLAWVVVPQAEGSRVLFAQGVTPLMRRHERLVEPFLRACALRAARRLQAMAVHTGALGAMATPELNRWIDHLRERREAVRARRLEFERAASASPAASDTGSEGSWEKIETYKKGTSEISRASATGGGPAAAAAEESKED